MICIPGFRLRFKLVSMTCTFSLLNTRLINLADLLTLWLRLVVSSEERILGPCLRVFGIVEHPICSAERVLLWVEGKFWFRLTNRYKVVFVKNGSANLQIEQADDDWHLVPRQVLIEQMHYLDIKIPLKQMCWEMVAYSTFTTLAKLSLQYNTCKPLETYDLYSQRPICNDNSRRW